MNTEAIRLVVRGDDFGMCHSVNLAFRTAMRTGILSNASLMVPPPWFEEAAEIAREQHPFSVGVHLTLTAEWDLYRWKPVLPQPEVSTLVDPRGYFWHNTREFLAGNPDLQQVERELRAQIDIALDRGVDVAYLDAHMNTALSTPALTQITTQLAAEYRLPISMTYGEELVVADPTRLDMFHIPPSEKLQCVVDGLEALTPGFWMMLFHPGLNTVEMDAIKGGRPQRLVRWNTADHRSAETRVLISPQAREVVTRRQIQLVTYRDMRDELRK